MYLPCDVITIIKSALVNISDSLKKKKKKDFCINNFSQQNFVLEQLFRIFNLLTKLKVYF